MDLTIVQITVILNGHSLLNIILQHNIGVVLTISRTLIEKSEYRSSWMIIECITDLKQSFHISEELFKSFECKGLYLVTRKVENHCTL